MFFAFIFNTKNTTMQRITLNTVDTIHIEQVKGIIYCKSKNSYTTFHFTNHTPIMISQSIKAVDKQLNKSSFFRPHKSYLVTQGMLLK